METNEELFKKPVENAGWSDDDEVTITFRTLRQSMREGFEMGVDVERNRIIEGLKMLGDRYEIDDIIDFLFSEEADAE